MSFKNNVYLTILFSFFHFSDTLFCQESVTKSIDQWLMNGPYTMILPANHNQPDVKGNKFTIPDLWKELDDLTKNLNPTAGDSLFWTANSWKKWQPFDGQAEAHLLPGNDETKNPQIVFLASYLTVDRWTKLKLTSSSFHYFEVAVDGKVVQKKQSAETMKDTTVTLPGSVSSDLSLIPGKHTFFVKVLREPDSNLPYQFESIFETDSIYAKTIHLSTEPTRPLTFDHMMKAPIPADVSISADGKWMAVKMSQYDEISNEVETWIEIRKSENGQLKQSFKGIGCLTSIQWSPVENSFAFIITRKTEKSIWLYNLASGSSQIACKIKEGLRSFKWLPDGTGMALSISEKPEVTPSNLVQIRSNTDRQPGNRNVSSLYHLDLKSHRTHQLIHSNQSANLLDISPDCQTLLYYEYYEDPTTRPYSLSRLMTFGRSDNTIDTLGVFGWMNDALFSPDGKQLLLLCGPSLLRQDSTMLNDYDTQAYLMNLQTKEMTCITTDFSPSIVDAQWKSENTIFFKVWDKDQMPLYQFDIKCRTFSRLSVPGDCVRKWSLANENDLIVCTVFGGNTWTKVANIDLKKNKSSIEYDPAKFEYTDVNFGKIESSNHETVFGPVQGRYYLPPDFDTSKKYPCIVYYYGGTTPVSRTFGGRYPFELYAAHGYVVLVLNPSGGIGFGLEHSATHVNDWGKRTAKEIIEAAQTFLLSHDFVDHNRVGCIGASFGGFMTQLLLTQTDMFQVAISHAGISNIASYWGEGYWGISYNAVSATGSFPWNRPDIYVDQSPLYHADKITTPLLLLHGDEDTNVPIGESTSMYNALRILNKNVELVFVKGQNHHINQPEKRKEWTYAILAWFDRWLKDEPEWWEDMFKN